MYALFGTDGRPVSSGAPLTDDCLMIFKIFIKLSPTKCLSALMPEMFANNQILSYNKSQQDALFLNFLWLRILSLPNEFEK
jgi:hypothetical protein